MKGPAKVGLVIGGYVAAVLLALGVVAVYEAVMDSPVRQASSGMYAFSDALLFLTLFGIASIPATCGAFYFLRPYPMFWKILSIVAVVSVVATLFFLFVYAFRRDSGLSVIAILGLLLAPLFASAFFFAALFAPNRDSRIALFGATVVEGAAFGCAAILLVLASS